jgi:DNA-binding transcriptional MerR regulator
VATSRQTFNTIGEIARRAEANIHRVEYLIRSRGIRPSGMAGNARVFSEDDAIRIVRELRRLDYGRAGGPER